MNEYPIENLACFHSLNHSDIVNIRSVSRFVSLKKGEVLYNIGDTIPEVFVIINGSIKVAGIAFNGDHLVKMIGYEGDIIGENIFAYDACRSDVATSMTDCLLLVIPISLFKHLIVKNHSFYNYVLNLMLTRNQTFQRRIQALGALKAKERVTSFIKECCKLRGVKIGLNEILINYGMTLSEIAYLTDTSKQTVARILSDLKSSNVIHFSSRKPNKILVRDLSCL